MKLRSGTKTPGWSLLSNKKNNLLFLVIFAVLYFLMKTPVWIFLTATILLVKILDNKKYYILAIANIICWLFTWKAFDYQLFEFATNTYSNSVAIATIKAIIIFFVLTAFYFFHKKSNKKLKTLFPGIVILIYITTMAIFLKYNEIETSLFWEVWRVAWGLVVGCSIYFIILLKQEKIGLIDLVYVYPFWGGALPIPGRYQDLKKSEDTQNRASTELSGLIIICSWLLLLFAADILKLLVLNNYYSGTVFFRLTEAEVFFRSISLSDYIKGNVYLNTTFRPIMYFSFYIIEASSMFGLQVGLLRLLGFNVMENIKPFWLAHGFYDFFKKINTYYSKILLENFILPSFATFNFIKHFKARIAISVFVSTVFWSTYSQLVVLQGARWLTVKNLNTAYISVLPIIYYNLIIAVMLAMSTALSSDEKDKNKIIPKKQFIQGVGYYLIYAGLGYYFIMVAYHQAQSLSPDLKNPVPMKYLRALLK